MAARRRMNASFSLDTTVTPVSWNELKRSLSSEFTLLSSFDFLWAFWEKNKYNLSGKGWRMSEFYFINFTNFMKCIMIPWNHQKKRLTEKEIEKALRASSNWKKHNQAQKTKSSCHQPLQQTNSFINVVIREKVHVSQKKNTRNH